MRSKNEPGRTDDEAEAALGLLGDLHVLAERGEVAERAVEVGARDEQRA